MSKNKKQIIDELEDLTFMKVKGTNSRSKKELLNVLRFEKKLRKK